MNLAVIMSIYKNDRLSFVKESVESILTQTCNNFDFYIQYDGPIADDINHYLSSLNDTRIHIHRRESNKGLAFSLNELIRPLLKNQYTYIARMDADDISEITRFEKQINFLETHPDIDCLGTWAIEIDTKGTHCFEKKMPITHQECLSLFRKRDCVIHPTVMFRNTYFEKAGLYPEDTYFCEDTIMWAQGFQNHCQFANFPDFLFKFRMDENFYQRRRGWKHAKSIYKVRKKVNTMLHFGWKENIYAFLYATTKMMPQKILKFIYQTAR